MVKGIMLSFPAFGKDERLYRPERHVRENGIAGGQQTHRG